MARKRATPLTQHEKLKRGVQARRAAEREILSKHQQELEELTGRNRVELGLPRRPGRPGRTADTVSALLERRLEEVRKLEEELAEIGG